MSREFSKREKAMLVFLAVLIIAVGYFKVIWEPINEQVTSFNSKTEEEQTFVDQNMVIVQQIKKMQAVIDEAKAAGNYTPIPSYDNSKELLNELYDILETTTEYQLSFENLSEDGYVMLRPISMSYITSNYEESRAIIDLLHESSNLNQISDVVISTKDGIITTNLRVTFFEVEN